MSSLADVLNTENEQEQVQLVEKLIEMAKAPVQALTLVYDPRADRVSIIANQLTIDSAYGMLEKARQELLRMEREALKPKDQPQVEVVSE